MNKQLITRVPLAVPTLVLAVAVVLATLGTMTAAGLGAIPVWAAGTLMFFICFAAFTPMHDATHRAVGKKGKINEIVGRVCAAILLVPFGAFRHIHLQHHRHTNDPEHDPDFYSGNGPVWQLPFRWLTQDLTYYAIYFRAGRPRRELIEAIVTVVLSIGAVVGLSFWLGADVMLLGWVLPSRLAIGALAFAFDYLPHHPHSIPASEDRYAASRIFESKWLTPVLMFQNYHLVHHLYPSVPFYRYGTVWWDQRSALIAKGARVTTFGEPAVRPEGAGLDASAAVRDAA
ncbi:MAG: fatty acid desaturase [Myxococcota bacterium]